MTTYNSDILYAYNSDNCQTNQDNYTEWSKMTTYNSDIQTKIITEWSKMTTYNSDILSNKPR